MYAVYPNGTEKWDFLTGNGVSSSPSIGPDGTIVFGSNDNIEYALYPNGTKKWEFSGPNGEAQSQAIGSDGTIYFGAALDDNLYALNPNGTEKWEFTTGGWIIASPVIDSDGTVYVGSSDGKLYAIGTGSVSTVSTAPLNLTAIVAGSQIDLKWTPPSSDGGSSITSYTIYRGTASGTEVYLRNVGIQTAYKDANITAGQKYFYQVTASNAVGEGPKSNEANAQMPSFTTPTSPLILQAVANASVVNLRWNAPDSDGGSPVTAYTLYKGLASGSETPLTRLDVMTYQDKDVIAGTRYYYQVTASNVIGEGPRSDEASAIIPLLTPPTAPQALQAIAANNQVFLNWSAPSSDGGSPITSYAIYRGTTPSTESFLAKVNGQLIYFDKDVSTGKNYYYRVTASNANGEGPISSEVSALLPAPPVGNHAPEFATVPKNITTYPERIVTAKVLGKDADPGDIGNLTYYLVMAPPGMTIDPGTGVIKWRPTAGDIGPHTIIVGVTDQKSDVLASFNITVREQSVVVFLGTKQTPSSLLIMSMSLPLLLVGCVLLIGTERGLFGMFSCFMPLYSKLKKEELLDNFVRGHLYGMVQESPGSSFSDLRRKSGKANGTVIYHLNTLEREGLVKAITRGTKRLYFPSSFVVTDEYFSLTDAQRVIYNVIKTNPGISQMGIARKTGFKAPRINKIIHRLAEKGMLDVVKGKTTRCFVSGDPKLADLRLTMTSTEPFAEN